MPERLVVSLLMSMLLLSVASGVHAKECSRFVTAQMRANAVANVKKYDWAAAEQQKSIQAVEPWMELTDDEIWALIPSQELPRDIHTNKEAGCPGCGDGIAPYGNYPWRSNFWGDPWKLTCPNCGEKYPKNDFYAFYKTALDEHGFFRRELGDRSLLFNADHPDPNDPLHRVYVDDGYGMVDEKGVRHRVIAYYNSWVHWRTILRGMSNLARAYTLTDDPKYAHKCAVLLDRIADVYPDMDFAPLAEMGFEHSHGGREIGRIQGCLWENDTVWWVSHAYDKIYDAIQSDEELVKFCGDKSAQYKLGDKSSIEVICRHVEENLLLEMLRSYKDGRVDGNKARIRNPAAAAIALDRGELTEEWLDYLFDPGFPYEKYQNPVPWLAVEGLDRDGMGSMCGGYGLMQKRSLIDLAEVFAAYPDYTNHDIIAEYPKLKQAFFIESRLCCLDTGIPNIGDSGATGTWGRGPSHITFLRGFKLYKDPRMAALAWRYAGQDPVKLRLPSSDIYEADPDAVAEEIASVAKLDELKLKCEHTGRYGQAVLQTEQAEDGRSLWLHYGYGKGHSHRDCLNIGLYAKNIDMLPELGYPEYTGGWPKRGAWTSNTISHNTLIVGDKASGYSPGGKLNLFAVQPPLRVMDVSSLTAYSDMQTYRRTVALVDVSETNSYVVDVFRARGGSNHRLSYHGPAQTATLTGISLVKQQTGTFASPEVEFATLDGEQAAFYKASGFTYLYDVERSADAIDSYFTVDWKCEDLRGRIKEGKEPHLRLHSLSAADEVALCSGDPPQNKRGNPRRLRYLIQSRLGDNVESQFITVLEPYDATPFIKQVRKLQVEHDADPNSVAAIAVELADGTTDILISCEERTKVAIEGGVEFDGQFGMIRLVEGEVKLMRTSNASLLKVGEVELAADPPAYEGTVTAIDASDPMSNKVSLDPPLPQDADLVGQVIHFQNELPLDTSYEIEALTADGISTGDITIIRRFKDNTDFEAGYEYLVNVGDKYIVPCLASRDL